VNPAGKRSAIRIDIGCPPDRKITLDSAIANSANTCRHAPHGGNSSPNATTAARTHRIPAPQAQAFVACRKITNDPQTGEIVIIGAVSIVLVRRLHGP
jgi:hypothetical protein